MSACTDDQTALVALRSLDHTDLDDFPLGEARTATIELTRFEPFPANARIEIVGADGPRPLALPDRTYFAGLVRGEPTSRVLVIAGATTVEGFVMSDGDVYPFGPDDHGRHRDSCTVDWRPLPIASMNQ